MPISSRLKEERQRAGLSQPKLASIAGASKSAVISWEKGVSAPTATALAEMAAVGFDILYILTGRRTNEGPDLSLRSIEYEISKIRRTLLEPGEYPLPDENEEQTIQRQIEVLETILRYKQDVGPDEQIGEVYDLLAIARDPDTLTAFRAADHAQRREKRRRIKEKIVSWIELSDQQPSDTAVNLMASLALEYNVPLEPLVELMYQLLADGAEQ